jgi:hypothetical protein
VRKVRVEPGASGSVVRVQLATADVAVKEMLLANPPRLVFDLTPRGPLPKVSEEQELAQEESEPDQLATTAAAEPAPAPAPPPAKVEEPKPREPIAVAAAEPHPTSPVEPIREEIPAEPAAPVVPPPPTPGPGVADLSPPPIAPAAERDRLPPPPPLGTRESDARRSALAAKAQREEGERSGFLGMLASPVGLAAVAGLVLLVGVTAAMRRRRAAEEEDALYTVMSAEDAGVAAEESSWHSERSYEQEEAASPSPAASDASSASDWDSDAYEASEPAFKYASGPHQIAFGAKAAAEPAAEAEPPEDPDSIFAGEPIAEPVREASIAASAQVGAGVHVPSVSTASAEMERRLADLERRLEQLAEARERLERQVAAQTEELRVQRAAIARTQRVVRSIAKTEDMATEPVPRAPSA